MKWLKFLFWCSVWALMGLILAKAIFGQSAIPFDLKEKPADGQPSRIEIKGGVSGTWLVVGRANKTAPDGRGFDPSYTYLVCDFKPMVKKMKDGRWLIQFTSEIAEGLP